jgi:hypothetical protein
MGAQSMVKAGLLFLGARFLAAAGCDQKTVSVHVAPARSLAQLRVKRRQRS